LEQDKNKEKNVTKHKITNPNNRLPTSDHIIIWNSLPQQLKDASLSLNVFKRKLKTHFLSMSSL